MRPLSHQISNLIITQINHACVTATRRHFSAWRKINVVLYFCLMGMQTNAISREFWGHKTICRQLQFKTYHFVIIRLLNWQRISLCFSLLSLMLLQYGSVQPAYTHHSPDSELPNSGSGSVLYCSSCTHEHANTPPRFHSARAPATKPTRPTQCTVCLPSSNYYYITHTTTHNAQFAYQRRWIHCP